MIGIRKLLLVFSLILTGTNVVEANEDRNAYLQVESFRASNGYKADTVLAGMKYTSQDKRLEVSAGGGASFSNHGKTSPEARIGFKYNF